MPVKDPLLVVLYVHAHPVKAHKDPNINLQEYSFTLTGGDGSHLHGFCRSFLPPREKKTGPKQNANLRYPQVLCILSPFQWFPFYYKVLQVVEALLKQGDLLVKCSDEELPRSSPAAAFLGNVSQACSKPQLGRVLRVKLPPTRSAISISPQRRVPSVTQSLQRPLQSSETEIELQIPPDTGNGSWNAGTPLARLFWHLPSASLMALLQALLLERRILMVAQEMDTLSAAVHAAAALLYPFRWQHIYLPLLPHKLKDYLTAPMPYLIGMPAPQMLTGLRLVSLEDVVYVDLDAGSCTSGGPTGPPLDHALLPWGQQLQAAFQIVYQMLRSPTEFESTPVIGHCIQEYFLKLLGSYREFVELDGPEPSPPPMTDAAAGNTLGTRQQHQDDGYLRAHGFRFDHLSFAANHRRSEKARNFLDMLRHSQMYEVFINERLALAAGGYKTNDAFEAKISYLQGKRSKVLGRLVAQAGAKSVSNLSAVLSRTSTLVKSGVAQMRHARNPSEDNPGYGRSSIEPETIIPSYTIEMESAPATPQSVRTAVQRQVPARGEDPTSFFMDPDSDDEAPPPSSALGVSGNPSRATSPTGRFPPAVQPIFLPSPTSTGEASLFSEQDEDQASAADTTSRTAFQTSVPPSLLDEDAFFSQANHAGLSTDSDFGLPPVFGSSSQASGWATEGLEQEPEVVPEASLELSPAVPSAAESSTQRAWNNRNSLETIDPFKDFHSPEAKRASSLAATGKPSMLRQTSEWSRNFDSPLPDVSPVLPRTQTTASTSGRMEHSESFGGSRMQSVGTTRPSKLWSSSSQSFDDRAASDPFSVLDPISRPASHVPMVGSSTRDSSKDAPHLRRPTAAEHSMSLGHSHPSTARAEDLEASELSTRLHHTDLSLSDSAEGHEREEFRRSVSRSLLDL